MNLFSGLEKFGLNFKDSVDLYEEEGKDTVRKTEEEKGKTEEKKPLEEEFLLDKTVRCPVCDHVFKTKMVKNGRVKRMEPDQDLRPRFQYIDTLKYDVTSCPVCGYTSLNRYFDRISSTQAKLVREQIGVQFCKSEEPETPTYSYDTAIDRYKLSLANTLTKRGKASELAYNCLKLAWLYRGKNETIPGETPEEQEQKKECREQEEIFYQQAYEGLLKAMSSEDYPICGMEESTVDYLLSYMSYHFGKNEVASKFLSSVLTSSSANRRMKDRALELKDLILAEIRGKRQ